MTSALPAPRDVTRFDASSEMREDRATIDSAKPTTSRISDRQLERACERNPHWQQQIGFSTSLFGGGDVASGDFAENVAEKQATLGLPVDGIAGPQTVGAVIRGTSGPDDPFAMHLLDQQKKRRSPGRRPPAAVAPTGAPALAKVATEKRIRAEITDLQPTEEGAQLVIGAGANHGVDESWKVKVVGTGVPWTIIEVRPRAIVVVSSRARVDNLIGLHHVELTGAPRTAAPAAAAAEEDEPAWWTLED